MALIKPVNGIEPKFGNNCYLAENATVVGDVVMGDECSVWFNAVVRGDVHYIRMGNRVNVQDGAVIHCTYKKAATTIGNNVSIGHNALVHGCTVKDNVLIGMGAIVMDNVVVEENTIIAAGAVVLENTHVESGCIYAGVPAKKVKTLNAEQTATLIKGIAENYVMYSGWFKDKGFSIFTVSMNRCGSFLFSFLVPFLALAQSSHIDSLKVKAKYANDSELFNKLSDAYIGLNPDSSEAYAYKALELSRKQKNKKQEAEALKNLGMAVSKKGEDAEAIKIFQQGVALCKTSGERSIEGDIYRLWGNAFYHQAHYDSALAKYLASLTIFRELDNKIKMAGVLNNIGNVYYFISRGESESYYLQALEIYKKLNDTTGLAKQYGNLGLVYINKQDIEKAIEYSQKSLEYNLIRNDKIGIATSYANLGYAYEMAEKYEFALDNVKKSLDLREQSGDKKGIAVSTTMLGKIYCSMRDYKNGIIYLEKGRELSEEINLNIAALEELEMLARAYYATGRLDDAQKLDEEILVLKEEEDEKKLQERVAELETEYKTKEKDAQIQIQELSLKRRSTYLWAAAGFIILLWVILGVSYNAYRSKQKTNALLEKKNKEISHQKEEITDSINYAQTIQRAILPPEKLLQKYLPDSFVIFKPKDIVSGDFYWTTAIQLADEAISGLANDNQLINSSANQLIFFAAVDCTGHGVPGAFMSIIGHNSLNRAVKDFKLTHPAEILDKLVELVTEALRAENQGEVKDGMDIALCCLDAQQMRLEYAGAYNPLYIVRQNEVLEFKADRQPIGAFEKRLPFTNHRIQLEKGDCVYVFSDGVADQFGGEKGKKLGSKRLKEWLVSASHLPASEQYTRLKTDFENWQSNLEQTDDVTLIGVRV